MSNIISTATSATDLTNLLSNSAKENEELLKAYNNDIKPKLKKIISQHSALGCIVGPLPTMGIATTINLTILFGRLSKVLEIPIMQELDKLVAPAILAIKSAFIKYGVMLAAIKIFITGLDLTGVGLPVGIISGVICGWYFSNKAGNIFANNIAKFVDETIAGNSEE